MLVQKRVEMWEATQTEKGTWILKDQHGSEREISDDEFQVIYEQVPERRISHRRGYITAEEIENGEVQGDSKPEDNS